MQYVRIQNNEKIFNYGPDHSYPNHLAQSGS